MAWAFNPEGPVRERPPLAGVYRRLVRFFGEFRGGIALGLGLSAVSTLLFVLLPFPVKLLIDGVLIDDALDLGPLGTITTATSRRLRRPRLLLTGVQGADEHDHDRSGPSSHTVSCLAKQGSPTRNLGASSRRNDG